MRDWTEILTNPSWRGELVRSSGGGDRNQSYGSYQTSTYSTSRHLASPIRQNLLSTCFNFKYLQIHPHDIIIFDLFLQWMARRGGEDIPEEQSRRDLILYQPSARSKNQCKNVMVSRSRANTQCDGATVAVTPDFIGLWVWRNIILILIDTYSRRFWWSVCWVLRVFSL